MTPGILNTKKKPLWYIALAPAAALDLITQRAIFEDLRADMTLEQAIRSGFSPTDKMISRGYTRSALWIRIKVDTPADAGAPCLSLVRTGA